VTDTLLLLDGHSLAYRAWFALPVENFATTTGLPTNAVYGFTAMLINVLRDEKPTKVAVAFDRSEPTFRHEKYVEYKAGRTKAPDEFRGQISLIFEVLDALGICRLSAAGYEADDIIATLATEAEQLGERVLIVTGDRDTFQLVSDSTTVLYNSRGVSDMRRYNPASLHEKYGLTPQQYPDFAALRGDPSDNLPSIPGVGEKTATKWIVEFGSLENLVNRVDEVKGKAGEALRAHLGSVLNNRELTTLIRDLPESVVGAVPADLTPRAWDSSSTPFSSASCATACTRRSRTACPARRRPRRWPARAPTAPSPRAPARGSRSTRRSWARTRSPSGWTNMSLPNDLGLLSTARGAAGGAR
jgi:DNA polymerase-1